MNSDTEQTVPPNRKSRLGTVALLFAVAPPTMIPLTVLSYKLGSALAVDGYVVFFFTLLCSLVAVVCGSVAHVKETKNGSMGYWAIRIGGTQLVLILLCLMFVFSASQVQSTPNTKRSEEHLKQLYTFMSIYELNFNCYPSMQPRGSETGGGVRDLYPLYLTALDKKPFLQLLRPPGVFLTQFSSNPGPDEFDTNHIGYIYNSTVVPGQSNNVPLMAERCVEDGKFTADEKPVFKDSARILMANGHVKLVPAKNGKLILPGDIKLEDLGKLK